MLFRDYLQHMDSLARLIESKERQIREIESKLQSCTAVLSMERMPQRSEGDQKIVHLTNKLIAVKDSIASKKDEYEMILITLKDGINRVNDPMLQLILTRRYLDGKTIREVAEEKNYSLDYMKELVRKAHDALENILIN